MAALLLAAWGFALGGFVVGAYLGKGIGRGVACITGPVLGLLCLALGVIVAAKVT